MYETQIRFNNYFSIDNSCILSNDSTINLSRKQTDTNLDSSLQFLPTKCRIYIFDNFKTMRSKSVDQKLGTELIEKKN